MANAAYNSQKDVVLQAQITAKQTTQRYFNVLDYSAKNDARTVSDGVTNSTTTVTSATAAFTSADVGKAIVILNGVATTSQASGSSFYGTIASVTNSTTVVVNTAVGFTGSSCPILIGTDNTTAFQNATNAAVTAGGGCVFIPGGNWLILGQTVSSVTVGVQVFSQVSYRGTGIGKTIVYGAIKAQLGGTFDSFGQSGTNTYHPDFFDFEIDNTYCTMSAYGSRLKGIQCPYSTGLTIQNMRVGNVIATGIACDFSSDVVIIGCEVWRCGRGNTGAATGAPGGNGIGIGVGGCNTNPSNPNGKESYMISSCMAHDIRQYGIYFEAQAGLLASTSGARIENCAAYNCKFGIGDAGVSRIEIIGNSVDTCLTQVNATNIPNGLPNGSLVADARAEVGTGIVVNAGTISSPPGSKGIIANNTCTSNAGFGIGIVTTSAQVVQGYTINGNRCQANSGHGIALLQGSSVAMSAVQIMGNAITGNIKSGLYLGGAGAGGFEDLMITDNIFQGNATTTGTTQFQCGICLDASSISTHIVDNIITDRLDSGTTQKYAIIYNSGTHTAADLHGNDLTGNVTGTILFTVTPTTSSIINNTGYNPQGPLSFGGVGASPWTYTAGSTPEALYISAGTVTSIVKNSVNCGFVTGTILLQPNEQVVITYAVAPTVVRDAR